MEETTKQPKIPKYVVEKIISNLEESVRSNNHRK